MSHWITVAEPNIWELIDKNSQKNFPKFWDFCEFQGINFQILCSAQLSKKVCEFSGKSRAETPLTSERHKSIQTSQ